MSEPTEPIAALAAIAALLIAMFFLFRTLPWSRPGPWRRIWSLAAMSALLFILAEAAAVLHPEQPVGAFSHQLPLFGMILAASAGFVATYFESLRGTERERILELTDPLTGLRNRHALHARVALALERGERFAVLWMDLDGFHLLNEAIGSKAGDALLGEIGRAVTRVARSIDLVARISGDAFALFLLAAKEPAVRLVAERVMAEMSTLAGTLPRNCRLSASFGAAGSADGRSAYQILEHAESAVARAGRAGGSHLAYASGAIVVRLEAAPLGARPHSGATLQKSA